MMRASIYGTGEKINLPTYGIVPVITVRFHPIRSLLLKAMHLIICGLALLLPAFCACSRNETYPNGINVSTPFPVWKILWYPFYMKTAGKPYGQQHFARATATEHYIIITRAQIVLMHLIPTCLTCLP